MSTHQPVASAVGSQQTKKLTADSSSCVRVSPYAQSLGEEKPQGEQDQFHAEQDDGRCRRAERLAGVDGWRREPTECGSADEAADMRRVADIGDGESEVEVQGGQDQELADQGILPGEGAAAHRVTEHTSEET